MIREHIVELRKGRKSDRRQYNPPSWKEYLTVVIILDRGVFP